MPDPAAGTFDRPAAPAAVPGFEVGGLPNQLVVPGGSPPVRLRVPAIGVETRLRFGVDTTRSFPKARFPTDAVFGPTPAAELRLVTCTGSFDRAAGSYRDNLVVFARLVATDGPNQG